MKEDPLIGRIIHNRFQLEVRLGVGGMGAVYRAKHLFLNRIAAIKIIQPEQRSQEHFRAWFLREARAVNMINHAHIVEIYDYGETEDGLAYLVMEFLDGIPLSKIIAKGPMNLRDCVDILEQVCAALARAHDMGVIHRDLKPDNIYLIERGGKKNFVKILDFGLAKVAREGRLAEEGSVFGTPEYISPEQARGEDATSASDLYSLGVIFYEMVTGKLPFAAKDRDKLFGMHIYAQPQPPSYYIKNLSPTVEHIIMKLLSKNPEERFSDAHHLLEEIKKLQRMLPKEVEGEGEEISYEITLPRTSIHPQETKQLAAIPEFAKWAIKSTIFARMVARAYPFGNIPPEVSSALDRLWKLTAESARIDGEISTEARKLEKAERKVADFKAQLGRRIEELSREASRLTREISRLEEELERRRRRSMEIEEKLSHLRDEIDQAEKAGASAEELKRLYENAGSLHATFIAGKQAIHTVESKIVEHMEMHKRFEKKISSYRTELERKLAIFESEIKRARQEVERKGIEGEVLRGNLIETSSFLVERLYPVRECKELFEELEEFSKI